jgi:aryl-alcohol dehydrogenase-like predicted oxidoreductase
VDGCGAVSERTDAVEAIRTAIELGVTSIDTAPIYGQGDSEEIVGEAIKGLQRDKIQILTKYGMRWDLAKGNLAFKSKNNEDGKSTYTSMPARIASSKNAKTAFEG